MKRVPLRITALLLLFLLLPLPLPRSLSAWDGLLTVRAEAAGTPSDSGFPSDDKIIATAQRPALRMVRRQVGKVATAELDSMRSFYRPYYIAFYGELKMGERVRYLPIPADGFRVDRAL